MTEYSKPGAKFWTISAFGLIWSVMGCYNYIMQTNPEALAQFPEAYQMVIKGRPGWVSLSFVIAVFGGALGSALMLMRRAVARPVLLLSLLGVVVTFLQALWVIDPHPGLAPLSWALACRWLLRPIWSGLHTAKLGAICCADLLYKSKKPRLSARFLNFEWFEPS